MGVDYQPGKRPKARPGTKAHERREGFAIRCKKLKRVWQQVRRGKSRLCRVYLGGAKPARCFGVAVNGLTDKELHDVRRKTLMGYTPRHGGTSMRAK